MNIKSKLTLAIGILVAMIVLLVVLSVVNLQILTATEPDSPAAGASQRAGGADRGNRSPVWNGKRTGQNGKERKDGERQYAGRIRKGAGILHPVVVP